MPTPNFIKYSTTPDDKSIKVGNYSIGVASGTTYGPTSGTSYWSGISPPTSGYTIYENKVTNGPSIRVPSDSETLIDYANRLYSGSSITTEAGALVYFNSLNTVICVNRNYEEIVTSGLTLLLDAGFTPSYPKSGTSWTDLSFSGNNGTLINGPTFNSSNGGSLVFDGVDDYVGRNTSINTGQNFTVNAWIYPTLLGTTRRAVAMSSNNYTSLNGWLFSTAGASINNTFFFSVGNDNAYRVALANTLSLNQWAYISAVCQNGGGSINLYKNGIETSYELTSLSTNTLIYTYPQFNVGYRDTAGPTDPYTGNIAQVTIYNKTLTASEVLQNYNATKSRFGL